jgi:hypothetical protein
MGFLVVVFGSSAVLSSSAQQRDKYVLTIVQQPESPIEILEVGVAPTDPPLILPWIRYKNRSKISVLEYTLWVVITTAKGRRMGSGVEFSALQKESPGVLVEEEILQPGEERTIDRRSPEEVEKTRAELHGWLKRNRFEESQWPVKVEFLVRRAVLQDGTVFNADGLAKALDFYYK